jgi:NAD(P)-dependent dehydrogenase (short-subunit alcohol dehydrogenase family)
MTKCDFTKANHQSTSSKETYMWIFLKDSFLSIVDKGGDGTTLLVRARKRGDIENVFPNAKVVEGGGTDYGFRARIHREEVAQAILWLLSEKSSYSTGGIIEAAGGR